MALSSIDIYLVKILKHIHNKMIAGSHKNTIILSPSLRADLALTLSFSEGQVQWVQTAFHHVRTQENHNIHFLEPSQ